SPLARLGLSQYAPHCASEQGIIGLVRALSLELSPENATVNAVCRGWMEAEPLGQGSPAGSGPKPPIDPDEIARVVAHLAQPESRSISGQVYIVDQGS